MSSRPTIPVRSGTPEVIGAPLPSVARPDLHDGAMAYERVYRRFAVCRRLQLSTAADFRRVATRRARARGPGWRHTEATLTIS